MEILLAFIDLSKLKLYVVNCSFAEMLIDSYMLIGNFMAVTQIVVILANPLAVTSQHSFVKLCLLSYIK